MATDPWLPQRRPMPVLDEGDAVLVVPTRSRQVPVRLNPTAMALWELCDGETLIEEMVVAVCDLFTIDPEQARADVETALRELRAAELVT